MLTLNCYFLLVACSLNALWFIISHGGSYPELLYSVGLCQECMMDDG